MTKFNRSKDWKIRMPLEKEKSLGSFSDSEKANLEVNLEVILEVLVI